MASAQPARRADQRRAPGPGARRRPLTPATIERRRRELHLRRRRRDLLEDFAAAILLMTVALVLTAGLGVIALLDIGVAAVLIGSVVVERWLRSRSR